MSVFSVAVHAHLLLISWEAAFCDGTTGSSALEEGVMAPRQSASGVSLGTASVQETQSLCDLTLRLGAVKPWAPVALLMPFMGLQNSHSLYCVLTGETEGQRGPEPPPRSMLASYVWVLGWVRAGLCSGCAKRCFCWANGLPVVRAGVLSWTPPS